MERVHLTCWVVLERHTAGTEWLVTIDDTYMLGLSDIPSLDTDDDWLFTSKEEAERIATQAKDYGAEEIVVLELQL